jgi:hypothetical protein
MVPQQRFPPNQLLFVTLIIIVLLSSLSRLHDPYSECSPRDADVATTLESESTSLASQQSYGLFDDIPDHIWELMRKQAHREHMYLQKDPSSMPQIQNKDAIIEYLSNLEVRT